MYNEEYKRWMAADLEDADLKPLQILFVNVVMGNRYFTKDQIFNAMERIQDQLRPVEVMGEIRRGRFVILAYRTPYETAKKREQEITALCKQIEKEKGFAIRCQLVEEDERKAIERFEQAQTEDMA